MHSEFISSTVQCIDLILSVRMLITQLMTRGRRGEMSNDLPSVSASPHTPGRDVVPVPPELPLLCSMPSHLGLPASGNTHSVDSSTTSTYTFQVNQSSITLGPREIYSWNQGSKRLCWILSDTPEPLPLKRLHIFIMLLPLSLLWSLPPNWGLNKQQHQ